MTAVSAVERMALMRQKAEQKDHVRALFARFMRRVAGEWSASDIEEYKASVSVLMNGSDADVLALFPSGLYETADQARDSAAAFWKVSA